jgi:ribosomal protein L27
LIKKTTYLQKTVKTAKERLGRKYADEQRVNNCKVPIKKRGNKPRPDQCHTPKF